MPPVNLQSLLGPDVNAPGRQFGSLGGAIREAGTDRALTAADLTQRFAERTPALQGLLGGVEEDDLAQIQQFLNPTLTGEQQGRISRLARLSQGRGLQGAALNAQLNALNTQFLASNRVQGFGTAAQLGQERLAAITGAATPFLGSQEAITNQLENFLESGQGSLLQGIPALGTGLGAEALQALTAVGLGEQAFHGIAGELGATLGGRSEDQPIQDAFRQFLRPEARAFNLGFASSLGQHSIDPRGPGFAMRAALLRRSRGARLGQSQSRLQLLAAARQAAGGELANQVRSRLSSFGQGLADVQAQFAGAQTLLGTREGQQQILGQDLSRFGQLFNNIGLTAGRSNINTPVRTQIASGLFAPGRLFG